MIVTNIVEEFPFPVDKLVRPDGPHVGSIIHDLVYNSGILSRTNRAIKTRASNGEIVKEQSDMDRFMNFTKGFLWEETLSFAFGSRYAVRPPSIQFDGIWCSPDGIGVLADEMPEVPIPVGTSYLEEYKATNMSSANDLFGDWCRAWVMQTKAYCFAYKVAFVRFRVLHLCGNYREIRRPDYKTFWVQYTPLELAENWSLLYRHAIAMGIMKC